MALLIDGHNIIGAGVFEDIQLSDEDDEARLVARLKVWKSRYGGPMTVVFDRGVTGGLSREMSGAGVKVVFARNPQEADDLIRRRIRRSPANLVVVTNDFRLREEARVYRVTCWSAAELVERLQAPAAPPPDEPGAESEVALSQEEVEGWMDLFGTGGRQEGKGGEG